MKLSSRPFAFTSSKAFLKNRKRSGTSFLVSFSAWYLDITRPNSIAWLPLLSEILGNMCIVKVFWSGCDVIDFEMNLIFLIKPFFLHDQKVKTKNEITWERKELLRWNKKHFSLKFIKQIFFEGEGPTLSEIIGSGLFNQNLNGEWYPQ